MTHLRWDLRANKGSPAQQVDEAHSGDINSISFNPFNAFLFATASRDHVRCDCNLILVDGCPLGPQKHQDKAA